MSYYGQDRYIPQGPPSPWRGSDWYRRPEDEEEGPGYQPSSTPTPTLTPTTPMKVAQNDGSRRISTPEDIMGSAPSPRSSFDNDVTGGDDSQSDDSGYTEPVYDPNDPDNEYYSLAKSKGDSDTEVSSKERKAYDDYIATANSAPTRPKPGVLRKLGAMAVGGLGGYINSGGRTRVDTSDAVEGILYGDYNRRQQEWKDQVKTKADAAAMENRRNVDINADINAKLKAGQLEAVKDRDEARNETAKIRAGAQQTVAQARAAEAGVKQQHETYVQGEVQRKLEWIDKLNVGDDVKEMLRANAVNGKPVMTKKTDVRLSGAVAAEDAGYLKPGEGAQMMRQGEAQKKAESDSRINKNNRAPQPRTTQTPEQRAGAAVAQTEMQIEQNNVRVAEAEIAKLTHQAKELEAKKNAYEQMQKSDPNRQTTPDKAAAEKTEYLRQVQMLEAIWGKGGLYEAAQQAKQQAYGKLKEKEAMRMGQPPPVTSAPSSAPNLPPVAPPPPGPSRPKVRAP